MTVAAVIVAAGKGLRLGGPVPKQYRILGAEMVLTRTVLALRACGRIGPIAIAIGPDARALYDQAMSAVAEPGDIVVVDGGAERADSVRLALEALAPAAPDRVLIHDAARPFVDRPSLEALCAAKDGAIVAEPVVDALWRETDGLADEPVPRAGLWRAQTPQAFPFDQILAAHRQAIAKPGPAALDDAEIYRRAGGSVALIPGSPDNFKITTAADLARAERLVAGATGRSAGAVEVRTGQGFDVHSFVAGDGVWLCGVHIPHNARLEGHSDADVGLHALSDALYGALAEGDIGTHFPPSDPKWKGAASHIFLSHAARMVAERGGRIVNVDVTLLCERPRVLPHAASMRDRLAEIMGVSIERVSIKATTMERMGFIGREEGMGCIANAAIEVPR